MAVRFGAALIFPNCRNMAAQVLCKFLSGWRNSTPKTRRASRKTHKPFMMGYKHAPNADSKAAAKNKMPQDLAKRAAASLAAQFDGSGGLGGAPKFRATFFI